MKLEELKTKFPLLAQASSDELSLLMRHVSRIECRSGEYAIRTAEQSDSLLLILEGKMRVSLESEDECLILGEVHPGEWVGAPGVIEPAPGVASVIALEDCVFLRLRHDEFMALRRLSPTLTSVLLQMFCDDITARLHATVRFIDESGEAGGTGSSFAEDREWVMDAARKLIGAAARVGA